MLKVLLSLFVAVSLSVLMVNVIKAQTPEATEEPVLQLPDELPETPQDAADGVLAALTTILGMLTTVITNIIKNTWPKKIVGPTIDLVAAVTAAVLTFVGALLTVAVGFIEITQIWPFLVWVWPIAKGIAEGQKLVRGVGFIGSTDTP